MKYGISESRQTLGSRRQLLVIAGLLLHTSIRLRMRGYRTTIRTLPRSAAKEEIRLPSIKATIDYLVWYLDGIGRYFPWVTCLSKSIVLWYWLNNHGIESNIVIGANNEATFKAHAWVEIDGKPINDDDKILDRFTPLNL